ncbi:protein flp [Aplysia californica]|uniref:Protein flp n=1 Tax=Aplysia californica TaxID=6500 RepID=A0ABM1W2M9_APLCA|nr:protein flp [Aplysia californica]
MTYCGTVWLTFVVSLSTVLGLQQLTQDSRRELKEFVQAVMKCNDIPGVQVAMTTRNQTVLAEGYGAKKLATGEPMTSSTLQCIGSNTKSFTAMLAVMAVQEGKMDWDKPITDYFGPDFKLQSEYRTQHVSIKDLLSHRTGMPSYWGVSAAGFNTTFQEVARRIKDFPVQYSLRDRFVYSNYGFVLAAAAIEKVLGETWEQSVQRRLLDKIGMDSTRFSPAMSAQDWSQTAYSVYQHKNESFQEYHEPQLADAVGSACPAGCIFSTPEDMAKWGRFIINGGVTDKGERLVDLNVMRTMFIPVFPIAGFLLTRSYFPVDSTVDDYALGMMSGYYAGYKKLFHTGGYNGYNSIQTYLPGPRVGVYVAVTASGRGQPVPLTKELVTSYALDLLTDNTPWLNASTVCTFPAPWLPPSGRSSPQTTTPVPPTPPIIGRSVDGGILTDAHKLDFDFDFPDHGRLDPRTYNIHSGDRSRKAKLEGGHVDIKRNVVISERYSRQGLTGAKSFLNIYEGTYSHPAFGDFYIKMEGDKLRYHYGTLLKGELTPTAQPGEFLQNFDYPWEPLDELSAVVPVLFKAVGEPGKSMAAVIYFLEPTYPPTFYRA